MNIDVPLGAVIVASSVAAIAGGLLPGGAGNAAIITTILSTSEEISITDATTAGFIMVITSIWIAIPLGMASSFLCKIDIHLGDLVEEEETLAGDESGATDKRATDTDEKNTAGNETSPSIYHSEKTSCETEDKPHKKIFK